ncbi:MAG: hypothetical protein QM704_00445 [Anaeromyxobacteraceae bacterium]
MPKTFPDLTEAIGTLAAAVSQCAERCAGVNCGREAGVLPRCLFVEPGTNRGGVGDLEGGTVVVGLNPGKMKKPEARKVNALLDAVGKGRDAFSADDWRAYTDAYYAWMRDTIASKVPYYTLLRLLVRAGGRRGPILWTEIVKCQSKDNESTANTKRRKGLYRGHQSTVRRCTSGFLVRELDAVPKDWPILAAGADAFDWLSANADGRTVVGVPHPSGAAFQFFTLFAPVGLNTDRFEWKNGKWHSAKQ